MKTTKTQLLAASAVASLFATVAQAQTALPPAELHGAGASSIANVLPQSLNCIGQPQFDYAGNPIANPTGLNRLGRTNGTFATIPAFNYTLASAPFNCATREIQPDFQGRYLSSGSGGGKDWWRLGTSTLTNPFPQSGGNTGKPWTNVQFAFSDSPLSVTEFNSYNTSRVTSGNNINGAGAAVQVPFYVLPVALAYNPVYATYNHPTKGQISLTLKVAKATANGGLKLDRAAYCGILNGTITNFNDAALAALNGTAAKPVSLKDDNDDATRWSTVGAPIRLVGRSERSGTTDIFTRALAQQCDAFVGAATNKFDQAAETLPYNTASGINLSALDSATELKPSTTRPNAGSTTSISGAFFNKSTGLIDTTNGAEAAGKFMVANGSDGVAAAVNYQPALSPTVTGAIQLNGKLGYIASDWVLPSTINNSTLVSAQLQIGSGTTYAFPTAKNATAAFGTVLPPESSSTGAYAADARSITDTVNGTHSPRRANPLDWVAVAQNLGNPSLGYPITGTANLLTSTCFKDPANRFAMVEFMGVTFGKVTKDSTGAAVSANLIKGTGTPVGLLGTSGIATVPTSWITAITETFLKKSTQNYTGAPAALGAQNLWIQSKIPTTAADVTGTKAVTSNPTCTAGLGA